MRARHHAASALEAIYCVTHAALRVARSDSIHGSPGQGAELDAMGRGAGGGDAIIQPRGSEGTQGFPHDGPRTSRSRSQPAYNRCLYLYWLNTLVAWTPVPGVQRCWPIMRPSRCGTGFAGADRNLGAHARTASLVHSQLERADFRSRTLGPRRSELQIIVERMIRPFFQVITVHQMIRAVRRAW